VYSFVSNSIEPLFKVIHQSCLLMYIANTLGALLLHNTLLQIIWPWRSSASFLISLFILFLLTIIITSIEIWIKNYPHLSEHGGICWLMLKILPFNLHLCLTVGFHIRHSHFLHSMHINKYTFIIGRLGLNRGLVNWPGLRWGSISDFTKIPWVQKWWTYIPMIPTGHHHRKGK